MSYLEMKLGEIATNLPGATSILFSHKINFCCNGDKTLQEVIEKKGLNPDDIVPYLQAMAGRSSEAQDWTQVSNADLIEHILTRYHAVHREQLTELIRLAARVETVHGAHELCPNGLANLLSAMQQELEQHMQKEETILFPLIAAGKGAMTTGPIAVMMSDHEQHIQDIEKIYQLTNDLSLHAEACNTWRALYLGLQEFITDINMHIHIENNILFARALNQQGSTDSPSGVGVMTAGDIKKSESPDFCCGSCS